jgi:serine/threonine-protein kinase RsbW
MTRESWLPANPRSAAIARAVVRDEGSARGLREEDIWDLTLATTEAVTNAVRHGTPCGDAGFLLRVESCDDGLFVEVCDCGGEALFARPTDIGALHGRGLPLMAAVSDILELQPETDFTRVRFGKRLAA